MMHPYSTIEYGESLRHIGEPIHVPEWGTTVLKRACGMGHHDAIGTYPIAVLQPDCDLAAGLDRLARMGLVSVVLVLENVLRPELRELERTFDVARPFKRHYLFDRAASAAYSSQHHHYEVRRAVRKVRVERFDLTARLGEWTSLYQLLVARRGLAGTFHAFPDRHHEVLARLDGVVAVGAFVEGRLVSCHLWVCHDGHAMSHLAASDEAGYASGAAYAVNDASIELLTQCRILNFGGAAGADDDDEDGLVRFKRGFSNATAPSYLCGKVLAAASYAELSRQAGVTATAAYFPAYRRPAPR
jgi:GNAT acetyltransferase-like protein